VQPGQFHERQHGQPLVQLEGSHDPEFGGLVEQDDEQGPPQQGQTVAAGHQLPADALDG